MGAPVAVSQCDATREHQTSPVTPGRPYFYPRVTVADDARIPLVWSAVLFDLPGKKQNRPELLRHTCEISLSDTRLK
jgi:hypothetical protein